MKKIIILILLSSANQIFSMQNNINNQEEKRVQELKFLKAIDSLNPYEINNIKEIIELIKNVNINCKDRNGNSALHLACKKNNTQLVKLLLEKKANFLAKNFAEKLPVDYIDWRKGQDISQILLYKHQEINDLKKSLFRAIVTNNLLAVIELSKKISMGVLFEGENNPLHIAIQSNAIDVFFLILPIRPSLMFEKNVGELTPLEMLPNKPEILKKLLKSKTI